MSNSILKEGATHSNMDNNLVLLSENGSGRATAYADCNKIITLQDKTHVVWLDSSFRRISGAYPHVGSENKPVVSYIYHRGRPMITTAVLR